MNSMNDSTSETSNFMNDAYKNFDGDFTLHLSDVSLEIMEKRQKAFACTYTLKFSLHRQLRVKMKN